MVVSSARRVVVLLRGLNLDTSTCNFIKVYFLKLSDVWLGENACMHD